jgi:nicotinamidase-related amidase
MPLTKLDTIPALIVIDLQKGIVGLPTVGPSGEIIGRAARLASAFRERGLPVVLVNVSVELPDAPMPALPDFHFRRIGPTLYLNWRSNPAITL